MRQTSPTRTLRPHEGHARTRPRISPTPVCGSRLGRLMTASDGWVRPDLGLGAERWVTVREAARLAAVDPRTIRRWADTGRVRGRRTPGGHRQISVSGLDAAYTPAASRAAEPTADRDPAEAIPGWANSAVLWLDWRPPRRLSDDDLESLRLDVRHCRRALDDIEAAVTSELRRRDDEAVAAAERSHD